MYNPDILRIPENEDELWEILREQLDFLRMVLSETRLESYDEASRPDAATDTCPLLIRYRHTSPGMDNREHFLNEGRKLLPYITWAIDTRQLTPAFVQQWGKIMFCHGYIAGFILDDSDSLKHVKIGKQTAQKRSRDGQRKWLAHHMLPLIDSGRKRREAEEMVEQYVRELIDAS